MENFDFAILFLAILPILLTITFTVVASGYVARYYGDRTAEIMGRLTINPLKHIDLIGTIVLPLIMFLLSNGQFIFGWGKPMPINPRNFRNPRMGTRMVAISGPIASLLMCLGWTLIFICSLWMPEYFQKPMQIMSVLGIKFNAIFCVLNLIPIPPLDGGRFVDSFLSAKASMQYRKLESYGAWIILLLMASGLLGFVINPFIQLILNICNYLISLFG